MLNRPLTLDKGIWTWSPSAALLDLPATASGIAADELMLESEVAEEAGCQKTKAEQRANTWLATRRRASSIEGGLGRADSGKPQHRDGQGLLVQDLINVMWGATLARRMHEEELEYLLDSTGHLLEALSLPLLVQLAHILLGNTRSASSVMRGAEGGIAVNAAACRSCLLAGEASTSAPSITGYLDAATVVSPFDFNGKAADYALQLLLALRCNEARAGPFSSKLHQSVSETLTSMNILHINEVPVFGGVYHLDIVLSNAQADYCIAIEVDGPSHFLHLSRNGRRYLKFNAETRLKRRLLKRLGWKVVSLAYTRWNGARASPTRSKQQHQQEILSSLLTEAGFDVAAATANVTQPAE